MLALLVSLSLLSGNPEPGKAACCPSEHELSQWPAATAQVTPCSGRRSLNLAPSVLPSPASPGRADRPCLLLSALTDFASNPSAHAAKLTLSSRARPSRATGTRLSTSEWALSRSHFCPSGPRNTKSADHLPLFFALASTTWSSSPSSSVVSTPTVSSARLPSSSAPSSPSLRATTLSPRPSREPARPPPSRSRSCSACVPRCGCYQP